MKSVRFMAKFGSLDELRKKEEEDKENSNSYVGGDKSGLAVEHPDSSKDAWQRMQQLASSGAAGSGPLPADHRVVTVYRNGFTVGDGPFRPLSDPLNKKFMDEMAAGRCPAELQAQAGSNEPVHVAVQDKRGEDYKEPAAPAYVKFSGEGNTLGGSSSSTAAVEADKASMTATECLALPGAYNGLVGRMVAQQGFKGSYFSGGALSASSGVPDIGLTSIDQFASRIKEVVSVSNLPLIADADTGFGEGEMVRRTVEEYCWAGAAGLHIEDQVFPKRCGHLDGKALVPIDVFVEKVERAAEASQRCSDGQFIVCARTDAAGVPGEGFDRAVERAGAYEDFRKFAEEMRKLSGPAPGGGPFMLANMTEFGKTPYLTLQQFQDLGYHCVIYPVSTLRAAMKGVEECLQTLKDWKRYAVGVNIDGILVLTQEQGSLEPFLERMQSRGETKTHRIKKPMQEKSFTSSWTTSRSKSGLIRHLQAKPEQAVCHRTVRMEIPALDFWIQSAAQRLTTRDGVDVSKAKTKIQIRFHDGTRKAQEFNEDHTVGDLRAFCAECVGGQFSQMMQGLGLGHDNYGRLPTKAHHGRRPHIERCRIVERGSHREAFMKILREPGHNLLSFIRSSVLLGSCCGLNRCSELPKKQPLSMFDFVSSVLLGTVHFSAIKALLDARAACLTGIFTMVIPMQMPAVSAHFPAPTDGAVKRMKFSIMGGGISMVGRLVCAIAQGFLGQDFFGILNMLLSFTAGVFMFKEDERFASVYKCMASSICQTCAAQGMGGTQCLMPFLVFSAINFVMDLILRMGALAYPPYGIFVLMSWISQAAGAYFAWTAFKIMRDLEPTEGTEMGGGFALQGGDQSEAPGGPSQAVQGSSFTPFTGSGTRLGG
eukprot:s1765_g12.t2